MNTSTENMLSTPCLPFDSFRYLLKINIYRSMVQCAIVGGRGGTSTRGMQALNRRSKQFGSMASIIFFTSFFLEESTRVLPHTETRQITVSTVHDNMRNNHQSRTMTWVTGFLRPDAANCWRVFMWSSTVCHKKYAKVKAENKSCLQEAI